MIITDAMRAELREVARGLAIWRPIDAYTGTHFMSWYCYHKGFYLRAYKQPDGSTLVHIMEPSAVSIEWRTFDAENKPVI